MAIRFRDDAALEAVLRARLVPDDIVGAAARCVRDRDGLATTIEPVHALPDAIASQLRAIGVDAGAALPPTAASAPAPRRISCWAEAIAAVRVHEPELPSQVLLVVPRVADLIDLAGELVRLGCDRQELLIAGDIGVLRALDAPTYTLVRAADRDRGLRAFAPIAAPGARVRADVWCELGYRHPLASELRAAPDTLLAIGPDAWLAIPDHGWRPLSDALELTVGAQVAALAPGKLAERRRVELRFSPGRREPASLWVIRDGGVAAIDRALAYLPDDIVARLLFAVSVDGVVIVRARTGRHPAPELELGAEVEAYAAVAQLPDLFAPVGAAIEPPLRRERLRAVVGIDSREVMWLARAGGDRIRAERIADAAFQPLADWADYVLHANAPALAPWMRSSVFEFAPYVSTGREWADADATPERDDDAPRRGARRRERGANAPALPTRALTADHAVVTPAPPEAEPPRAPVIAIDAELAQLEAQFLATDAAGDAPERLALLARLAHAYARLARRRDAGLMFARTVWESPPELARARLDAWIADELAGAAPGAALARALAARAPELAAIRQVALLAARGDAAVAADPAAVQRWLDAHDGELDLRTLWLARLGLSRLAGGDALGLAHTRDRVLARLAGGLPVERELPAFLRLAGRTGALGTSGDHLAGALAELAAHITATRRKRSPVEAPIAMTQAYINFQLAYGFARLGMAERARPLVATAHAALARADAVHDYLKAAFTARVEQALAGAAAEAALPAELARMLAALDRIARYKVDRLREASRILEPHERPDAIGAFSKRQQDARGPEFTALRAVTDAAARARAIAELVATARADAAARVRLLDGAFDELLVLPESHAVPIFQLAWPAIDDCPGERRAALLADALVVAGHFGRTELVATLLASLAVALRFARADDLERVLHQGLRALRRIGLRDEIANLLADVGAVEAARPIGPDTLRVRLALASGLAYLGDVERALPSFAQARTALADSMTLHDRLELTRSLALAYANAPLAQALAGIRELAGQLVDITDSFGTNSHYCLAVLHFVESLVLGITSDDLVLGDTSRRFIEDDEHLIRRRVHRDLQGAS